MKEMNAVVGFLPDKTAKAIASGRYSAPLEIKMERGSDICVRVQPDDIAGVLLGASQKGETGVQVLLRESAKVETFTRGRSSDFLKPIKDLSIIWWWWRRPINVIYIDPQDRHKLIDLNKGVTR
jgi:hypothetical protein